MRKYINLVMSIEEVEALAQVVKNYINEHYDEYTNSNDDTLLTMNLVHVMLQNKINEEC